MALSHTTALRSVGIRKAVNLLNKSGYHYRATIKTNGKNRTRQNIANALSILHGSTLIRWTAFYEADIADYQFTHDRVHLSFFFEEDERAFVTAYRVAEMMCED